MNKASPIKFTPGTSLALGQVGAVVGGLSSIASGVIGSRRRRRETAEAQALYDRNLARFEEMDTSNPYANMENVYEDLTVNTQAADFAAQQQAQGQANLMDQYGGAAGGSGIAALAQAMAGQQAVNAQRAAVDIGQQERSNLMAERGMASQLQAQEREGEVYSRAQEQTKVNTLLGMSQGRLGAAKEAQAQARQAIFSGVGQLAGGVGKAFYNDAMMQGYGRQADTGTIPPLMQP